MERLQIPARKESARIKLRKNIMVGIIERGYTSAKVIAQTMIDKDGVF